jgi:ribosomal protein S25
MLIDTTKWLTAKQAAELAGVTPGRIRQLAKQGDIERLTLNTRMAFYSAASVRRWSRKPRPTGGRPRITD